MQEELENRTVTLVISTTKLTARTLKSAIDKYLAHRRSRHLDKVHTKPNGRQTVKQLVGQNQGVSSIEVTERNIKGFDRVARKFGVDYAIKKDTSGEVPKYLVFFKARDADALTAAFTEYLGKKEHAKEKPSIIQLIRSLKVPEISKDISKVRNKDKELSL